MELIEHDKGDTGRLHFQMPNSKADAIIKIKRENPQMRLKDIATQLGVHYGYVRNVYSKYAQRSVTAKGEASLPFVVQGWFWWNAVPSSWYSACPVEPSLNRNGQKRFQGSNFSCIIHKNGSVYVNPLFGGVGWQEQFRQWLGTWRSPDEIKLFMDSFQEVGKKEYAFFTPGVPKNYRIRIKGVGSFYTDTTPYPEGTSEFSFDPGLDRSIKEAREVANLALSAVSAASKALENTNVALGKFAQQLDLHYEVLQSMKEAAETPWVIRLLKRLFRRLGR